MKKNLLITLLLIPFMAISQTTKPIDGFLGVKFGASKAAVIAALKAKGATFDKENSDDEQLYFTDVKLGFRSPVEFLVRLVNDKAFEADYYFEPEVEAKVISEYHSLVDDITGVYGKGRATASYSSPYKAGDGDTLLGLSAGEIDFNTIWLDTVKNSVLVSITTKMQIRLTYQDGTLVDLAIEKQKQKQKSEF